MRYNINLIIKNTSSILFIKGCSHCGQSDHKRISSKECPLNKKRKLNKINETTNPSLNQFPHNPLLINDDIIKKV